MSEKQTTEPKIIGKRGTLGDYAVAGGRAHYVTERLPVSQDQTTAWPVSEKNQAYHERNQLVALLARLYPSGIKRTEIEGWDSEWHGCVYIDMPTGQASWHYHDNEAHLFADLPPYDGAWDGHTTEQKYRRIHAIYDGSVTCG